MENRVTNLFKIRYPIIQAGMVWTSGWKLASAVSNAGGLGIIGSGSMSASLLREHIIKCKMASNFPFAVNIPLLYPQIDKHIEVIISEKVPIVFSSAGNPFTWTPKLKEAGITVAHVISSVKFAIKAESAGCDAVVAEGFEAGGHNGKEETSSIILIPLVKKNVNIPVIAAGGIATGSQMLAALVLGAEGVQIGSRFVASNEASCHKNFKNMVIQSSEGDTIVTLKELTPVRILKNNFYQILLKAYQNGTTTKELSFLLGKGRAKMGIFEGNLEDGELEIGQASALIDNIIPAAQIIEEIWSEFKYAIVNTRMKYK